MQEKLFKVGVLAGGGELPSLLLHHCLKQNIPFSVITFKGQPKPENLPENVNAKNVGMGQVGKVMDYLKKEGVTHVVMAGFLTKTSIFDMRIDVEGLKILSKVKHKHDDALLSAVFNYLEENGFKMLGVHELCPEILMPVGNVTSGKITEQNQADIHLALQTLKALGDLDIGQAVIVKDGVVLGIEAVEGTAALIERCAPLRGKKGKGGILVKSYKSSQNLKVDLPTIGHKTIEQLAKFNYEGVAVVEGKAIFLSRKQAVELARKHKIFIVGVTENGATS